MSDEEIKFMLALQGRSAPSGLSSSQLREFYDTGFVRFEQPSEQQFPPNVTPRPDDDYYHQQFGVHFTRVDYSDGSFGASVVTVDEDSIAAELELAPGDIVIRVNGRAFHKWEDTRLCWKLVHIGLINGQTNEYEERHVSRKI